MLEQSWPHHGPGANVGGDDVGAATAGRDLRLCLLGQFSLQIGPVRTPVVQSVQRLLAFLALQEGWVRRSYAAGTLWGDVPEERAKGSLRSALWKLRHLDERLVEAEAEEVRLSPVVEVDYRVLFCAVRRALAGRVTAVQDELLGATAQVDLLPGWYEEWVVLERERSRETVLLALDALADTSMAEHQARPAILAALAAVKRDPLRESSHRALIRAHLLEGNAAEALRCYRLYARVLHDALRLEPSSQMHELVQPLLAASARLAPLPARDGTRWSAGETRAAKR